MKQFFLLVLIGCGIQFSGQAQSDKKDQPNYKTAIGLRYSPFGVSFKANSSYRKRSFEFIGYFREGFTLSGLYYWNFSITQPGNLKLYAGGGGQAGFKNEAAGGGATLGVTGVLGADYKFLHLPINVSIDWQPGFLFGKTDDFKGWGGIAARFTL